MKNPSRTYYVLLFSLVFLASSLFFAITKEVSRDVAAAQADKKHKKIAALPIAIASTTDEIATVIAPTSTPITTISATSTEMSTYIMVTNGCEEHFEGECLRVRSGPGTEFPAVSKLRNGVVLKISETVKNDSGTWHKIIFDEWLRYPERVSGDWYVAGDFVEVIRDVGELNEKDKPAGTSTKKIVVKRSTQTMTAYDGDNIFMTATTSTGLDNTPTPRGVFTIYRKTPSRYMQGPLPYLASDDYYDLPGVPWNLYFTEGGAVVHGAYWHDNFGTQHSHGCVNLTPEDARKVYNWADIGTKVVVQD
jgi:hypothetical protein